MDVEIYPSWQRTGSERSKKVMVGRRQITMHTMLPLVNPLLTNLRVSSCTPSPQTPHGHFNHFYRPLHKTFLNSPDVLCQDD